MIDNEMHQKGLEDILDHLKSQGYLVNLYEHVTFHEATLHVPVERSAQTILKGIGRAVSRRDALIVALQDSKKEKILPQYRTAIPRPLLKARRITLDDL